MEVDRKINEYSIQLKEVSDKIKAKSGKMQEIQGKISVEEAIDRKLKLENEIAAIKSELSEYKDTEMVCPKRKQEVEKQYQKMLNEYKKRKKICMEAINTIAENYPKGKNAMMEDIGIETDESCNFSLS